jgi:hypothetical protein
MTSQAPGVWSAAWNAWFEHPPFNLFGNMRLMIGCRVALCSEALPREPIPKRVTLSPLLESVSPLFMCVLFFSFSFSLPLCVFSNVIYFLSY